MRSLFATTWSWVCGTFVARSINTTLAPDMIDAEFPEADDLDAQFSFGWKWGFLVAAVLALATAPFHDLPKYYTAIPAALGVAFAVWVIAAGVSHQPRKELESAEPTIVEFRSDLWVQIKHQKAAHAGQLDLFEQVVEDSS